MRADKYLVQHGYFESRTRAQAAIKAGLVEIDGRRISKASETIEDGVSVSAESEHPYVSRGALKLAHALDAFGVDPTGRVCLDVGSSTGGFTEVLIERGAAKVYAVDVGRDQLHERLQGHARIVSMEGQDARALTQPMFDDPLDLLVCDASFIPISKVLPVPLSLTCEAVILVKPQFEVGRDKIGKGGIVKEGSERALADVSQWLVEQGWEVMGSCNSPITGGSGNREYLLHAKRL